jgi:MSHA biogenesis protein MshM
MYYEFFGLTQPPFKITPDTDVFFEGGNRGAILEALLYAIANGEGIIKVTGEVGSGKTMLCRVLQTRLPENVETVYLANPSVTPDEILHAIAFEMHLSIPKDAGRLQVMHALNSYLLERHAQKKQVVVFIEESQAMPISTLEEVRLLSNLETQQHKLLQIVLFGQPELDDSLRQPQIRQLRERITHSFSLAPLNEKDVKAYLRFRLRAAGYHGPDLFGARVISYMTRASGGLTRRINLVSDKALLAAFADGTHDVSLAHVKAAVADSEFSSGVAPVRFPPLAYGLGGLLLGSVLGIAVFSAYQAWFQAPTVVATIPATPTPVATPPANPEAASAPQPVVQPPSTPPAVTITAPPSVKESMAITSPDVSTRALPARSNTAPPSAVRGTAPELPEDWLDQRLLVTEKWLEQENGADYTLQLLGTHNPEQLREFFKNTGKFLEIERIYVYRTLANQRPSFTVLYGNFASMNEAYRALQKLPEVIKLNRPYYRTIQGVRAELDRYRS